jgi:two-component system osmolarity sensor histidine kinase EnvZ
MPVHSLFPFMGRISLFWRTFLYLAVLLAGSILAWQETFKVLELEPRAVQSARQIASLVNLTRAALTHADPIARVSLVKTLDDEEGLKLAPREPGDTYLPYDQDVLSRKVSVALQKWLGPGTITARRVNKVDGLWVGFRMGEDTYWLQLDPQRVSVVSTSTLLIWLAAATVLSLLGAAVIARLINRPLQKLSFATSRVREGAFEASRLDEQVPTSEIREVNIGFNRMARQLAEVEHDRSLMLAGISHDLRTPLARLRLEVEMSVPDEQARRDMEADIAQADAIIDQFLDYARPVGTFPKLTELSEVLDTAAAGFMQRRDVVLTTRVQPRLMVRGDPVDLLRIINNLLENARRYGTTPGASVTHVALTLGVQGQWIEICVVDQGPGVDPATLARMTQPFYRGDAARSQASGAGLGLAVVEKMLQRMGGTLALFSPVPARLRPEPVGGPGLAVVIRLPASNSDKK